ncbi:AAA family ATPase, partial [Microcoleus sp.]|uniref:ATP-binding protein n=1 Tax=Microcoleus sp. TaxID=44472 RepID=UPI0035935061
QIKLIDFSIASLLPRETQTLQNFNQIEGTLGYLSPEQTGRMNRGIDYRTDFYSLGVTFYELLAGELPFQSNDAMELVHSHIAKPPPSLHEIKPEIPQVLSQIVSKLMAKNAEDRYQSALGLKFDLEFCLRQLEESGEIEGFAIAQRDMCDRFIIPEKLYGRETEIETLLKAFERVATPLSSPLAKGGQRGVEMMLVAGFSGIGKTVVVNEIHKPIVRQRGYFIKGKFDQFNRNIPFSAFVQAFRDLMGQLLSESDRELHIWKTHILQALGDSGQVIIEVIPELEQIIGKQAPATELSGTAAQNRFNLLFQKFIQIFTTKKHPLVIFLDDLQWADSASFNLLQLLMNESESHYLLIIGAYRDNEVSPAHPLMLTLDAVAKANATINTITLHPLSQNSLNQLVADTLNCHILTAQPLTEQIALKTKGNPFFATQFLKALYQDGLIQFDPPVSPLSKGGRQGGWKCDIAHIKVLAVTDDVVEFMASQLQKLPNNTQDMLKLAACIGAQFDLNTLAIVSQQSESEAAVALWKALQSGLIIPQSEIYKFYVGELDTTQNITDESLNYKFLHDRVQQAAYSLIPDDQKQITHLTIGRLLLQSTSPTDLDTNIFEIVGHWNQAIEVISNATEIERLIGLNLLAGRKAKSSAAYPAVLNYLQVGLGLLNEAAWNIQYDLALQLHENAAEAAYLNGEFELAEQLIATVLEEARSHLDRVKVYEVQIASYMAQSRLADALQTGLSILKLLGIVLPEAPTLEDIQCELAATAAAMNQKSLTDLAQLPQMQDATSLAAIRILTNISTPTFQSAPLLFPFVVSKMLQLTIEQGNSPNAAFSYCCYGLLLLNVFQNFESAYEYGQLACQLDLAPDTGDRVSGTCVSSSSLLYIKVHLREAFPLLLRAYSTSGCYEVQ